ncbi:hypothetical protein B0T09DRAFT_36083 [Sordaria sp. MPI-SDFR-AT-0083]|nr:hypothetical protein B0T09DRAFT_36083 [Sordaria sp. MPI-SDFR-AT-0083]
MEKRLVTPQTGTSWANEGPLGTTRLIPSKSQEYRIVVAFPTASACPSKIPTIPLPTSTWSVIPYQPGARHWSDKESSLHILSLLASRAAAIHFTVPPPVSVVSLSLESQLEPRA